MSEVLSTIRVKVLFFGRLRELLGKAEDRVELASGASLDQLFDEYARRSPEMRGFRSSLVASCNLEFAAWGTTLRDGDEIAFLPPVSGG